MTEENKTVYRHTEEGTVLSTERATCDSCGTEGWRGDWSDEGGIVPLDSAMLCDDCAAMGAQVTEEEVWAADAGLRVNAGKPRSEGYDEGVIRRVRNGCAYPSDEHGEHDHDACEDAGSGSLEGLRQGHPGLWAEEVEA